MIWNNFFAFFILQKYVSKLSFLLLVGLLSGVVLEQILNCLECVPMSLSFFNPLNPNSRSKANFFFQFIASYVRYIMEKLAGDLLFGLKFVKLSILPTLFIHFVYHMLGELRSRY